MTGRVGSRSATVAASKPIRRQVPGGDHVHRFHDLCRRRIPSTLLNSRTGALYCSGAWRQQTFVSGSVGVSCSIGRQVEPVENLPPVTDRKDRLRAVGVVELDVRDRLAGHARPMLWWIRCSSSNVRPIRMPLRVSGKTWPREAGVSPVKEDLAADFKRQAVDCLPTRSRTPSLAASTSWPDKTLTGPGQRRPAGGLVRLGHRPGPCGLGVRRPACRPPAASRQRIRRPQHRGDPAVKPRGHLPLLIQQCRPPGAPSRRDAPTGPPWPAGARGRKFSAISTRVSA